MKAYRRSRIIDPFIFNLRNTWMWVVNFTSRPLYPGKEPLYQLNRRVRGPHREVMSILERRNLFYPPEFEHQIILSLAKLLHWQSYHGSCMYVCVYIYIYIYARSRTQICTHTYTHTNTHTHTSSIVVGSYCGAINKATTPRQLAYQLPLNAVLLAKATVTLIVQKFFAFCRNRFFFCCIQKSQPFS